MNALSPFDDPTHFDPEAAFDAVGAHDDASPASAPGAGAPLAGAYPGAEELAQLLRRTAAGEREAFTRLYERTRLRLFAVVLRIQHNRALAEDVLQEVYVNIWRAAAGFDAHLARPLTWMAAIARHRAIDSLRRRQGEPAWVSAAPESAGDDGAAGDPLDRLPSDDEEPLARLERAAQALAMRRCVDDLSREQRQCVALAFYQGLSHSEVADHLGEPLGTVKSWVRRGLLALRTCLDRAGAAVGGH